MSQLENGVGVNPSVSGVYCGWGSHFANHVGFVGDFAEQKRSTMCPQGSTSATEVMRSERMANTTGRKASWGRRLTEADCFSTLVDSDSSVDTDAPVDADFLSRARRSASAAAVERRGAPIKIEGETGQSSSFLFSEDDGAKEVESGISRVVANGTNATLLAKTLPLHFRNSASTA